MPVGDVRHAAGRKKAAAEEGELSPPCPHRLPPTWATARPRQVNYPFGDTNTPGCWTTGDRLQIKKLLVRVGQPGLTAWKKTVREVVIP